MAVYYASKSDEVSQRELEHMNQVRAFAGECMTVLENNGVLPLKAAGNLALYGNGARRTVKGGTGSGDVNSRSVVTIEEGLKAAGFQLKGQEWLEQYDQIRARARKEYDIALKARAKEQGIPEFAIEFGDPFQEPEIPAVTEKEADTDLAVFVIARNSGEGADRYCRKGDYLLTDHELQSLTFLGANYEKVIVVLNVGNVIDLSQMMEIPGIDAVLLAGQAGNVGGHAVADVLTGKAWPSGKLTDTWAKNYEDYASSKTFSHNNGNLNDEYYEEGIYVGYRYFDTFGVEPLYCFGYGKSYTEFQMETLDVTEDGEAVCANVRVTNIGEYPGKEVVQVYYSAPDGALEKPYQELAAFGKTRLLQPGESEVLTISWPIREMASYSEKQAAWILEKGIYYIRIGNSSRNTKVEAAVEITKEIVTEQLKNLFHDRETLTEISRKNVKGYSYPGEEAEKASARKLTADGAKISTKKAVYTEELREFSANEKAEKLTADDVRSRRASLEELVAQLTVEEMAEICNGTAGGGVSEGGEAVIGSSSAAVPGAAGDTTSLLLADRNIQNIILADGPAGLRLMPRFEVTADGRMIPKCAVLGAPEGTGDSENAEKDSVEYYQYCTAIPIATTLAQSWDMELIERVGAMVGREMEEFHVTLWLAPGMNIHRNPLCGRNFEYYSEDPLLSGMCAAADTKGVQSHAGLGTTIKHFAANNQEDNRMYTNAHISERALREIYLKGFEIAVKTSQPMSIMTSYNLLNGEHTANHSELLTAAARDEWGFAGMIMTDWGTSEDTRKMFGFGELKYTYSSPEGCVRAGNDLQMPGCRKNIDALIRAVREEGTVSLAELQHCTYRILKIVLESNAYADCRPYTEQFQELPWMVKVSGEGGRRN